MNTFRTIRRIIVAAAALSALAIPAASTVMATPPHTTQILTNAGFENGDPSDPIMAPWQVKDKTGDKIVCEDKAPNTVPDGYCVFRFKGSAGESAKLVQTLNEGQLDIYESILSPAGGYIGFEYLMTAPSEETEFVSKLVVKYYNPNLGQVVKAKLTDTASGDAPGLSLDGWWVEGPESEHFMPMSSNLIKVKAMIKNVSPSGNAYVDKLNVTIRPAAVVIS